jgi:hypothetical protein
MACFLFNNLYICNRGIEGDTENKSVLLSKYDFWFPNIIFINNPEDKIVLFFTKNFLIHNKLIEIPLNYIINVLESNGCIKFFSIVRGIRIFSVNLNFNSLNENLKIFKKYILELIKIFKYKNKIDLDKYKFALYWDCNIEKSINNILIENNLILPNKNYYFFSEIDLI